MAPTLRKFLERSAYYDSARASLMLAAATARVLGSDNESDKGVISGAKETDTSEFMADQLWPVQCLLQIGVSRDCLDTVLSLLNLSIPDELRNRNGHHGNVASDAVSSLALAVQLTKSIVSTGTAAIDLLLGLDEKDTS